MKNRTFPLGQQELKIGMIGMTEGNGHPYSWSAMFNDYDAEHMRRCPFDVIPKYLDKQPKHTIGIPGAKVTHICCNDRADAEDVARAARIAHVVDRPEDLVGSVDAVIVATDIGSEHVDRCRPFIEADLPMLIDKPLVDNEVDLQTFTRWHEQGKHFVSSSSLRYSKEMEPYHRNRYELGQLKYISKTMTKKWETYGIHALESIYPVLGPGFVSIQNTGAVGRNMVHIVHESGCEIHIAMIAGMVGAPTLLVGDADYAIIQGKDSYYAFKKQLDKFVHWLRTGEEPQPFSHTQELMKMVIGGIRSREEDGRRVLLEEIKTR